MEARELNKILVRWSEGQFCLLTEYQAVGDSQGRLYSIRYEVGGKYGYMVRYSRKVVRKIFLGLQKTAGGLPPSYLKHILYTSPDELGDYQPTLSNLLMPYIGQNNQ